MCITEYNELRTLAEQREKGRIEGKAEGRAEGRAEGILETLIGLVKKRYSYTFTAAEEANMTVPEFEEKTGLKA